MLDWVSLKASTICFMQGTGGVDDVVGEEDGEGFVADEFFGHENGVAEAEGLGLAGVGDLGELRDGAGDFEERGFVLWRRGWLRVRGCRRSGLPWWTCRDR